MELVHDLLQNGTPENLRIASKLLTYSVLKNASEQSKHKLKTRISSLLKSSGTTRAYGAILARQALQDWSIVKSHGSTWSIILLHVLDLPDEVCWKPVTKTLTALFVAVAGKPELARDIAGSHIGDFAKRLIVTLPTTKLHYCVGALICKYPTQVRPYINKLAPLVDSNVAALLCISEKLSTEVWEARVGELLTQVSSSEAAKASLGYYSLTQSQLDQLRYYIEIAAELKAKLPAAKLWTTIFRLLSSLDSLIVIATCRFILQTWKMSKLLYISKFDELAYKLAEIMDMGNDESVEAAKVLLLLVKEIGWVSEKYSQLFTRVLRKLLRIFNDKFQALGVEGLADFVQYPDLFEREVFSSEKRQALLDFVTCVSTCVPGIPQSVRLQIDKLVIQFGSTANIVQVTLYPSKYSVLPFAIDKMPTLNGLQSLVHPRLPPLNASKRGLDSLSKFGEADDESDNDDMMKLANGTVQPNFAELEKSQTSREPEMQRIEAIEAESETLPKIPEPRARRTLENVEQSLSKEHSAPPEKKARVDSHAIGDTSNADSSEDSHSQSKEAEAEEQSLREVDDREDDEEDLVIPVLNMDSD